MFSRFHTIAACDGQTDILRRYSPRLCRASRGKIVKCGENALNCMYITPCMQRDNACQAARWLANMLNARSGHFPPGHIPPGHVPHDIFPARTIPPPFSHGVGHLPLPPLPCANLAYIKRSTVNVYKIDIGYGQKCGFIVSVF